MSVPAIDRRQIRRHMRQQRRSLSPRERRQHAANLLTTLKKQLWFHRARHIALYLANDGEMDPQPVIDHCWAQGKTVYLPVLHPVRKNRLWFTEYRPDTPMCKNRFGIPEPVHPHTRKHHAWSLDLVLMPLVAFDGKGNRLGMGGGFYDRTFERLNSHLKKRQSHFSGQCRLIGLAYDFQQVEQLPHQHWDVPLYGIATNRGICFPGR